jgi:hypothetical protein
MATDATDPRVGLIVRIGILCIGTLIVAHLGITAYFDGLAKAETYRKIGSIKPEALTAARADEQQRLSSGPMPIDKSMQMMVAKGRMGLSPDLAPSASRDTAPLQGWMQMPSDVPPTMMAPEPAPAPAVAPSAAPSASSAPGAAPPAGSNNIPRHP